MITSQEFKIHETARSLWDLTLAQVLVAEKPPSQTVSFVLQKLLSRKLAAIEESSFATLQFWSYVEREVIHIARKAGCFNEKGK